MRRIIPLVLLAGCMVGPKYHEPEVKLPNFFEEDHFRASGVSEIGQWWKEFNDPILNELLEEATTANYDIRIAIEKIEQARAQYRIERSRLWPEIDLNATAARNRISQNLFQNSDTNRFFPTLFNIFQIGFDAIWELDFFGKFRHGRNAAQYSLDAIREDAESMVISMLSEVAINYVSFRSLQNQVKLTQEKLEIDERLLFLTKSLFEIGLASELDVLSLISTLESDKATLNPLQTSQKQSAFAIAYLLGKDPEGIFSRLGEEQPIPSGINRVPVGLPSDLLRRRHDVRSAERQLAAATEKVGMAVADLFPHISLTGLSFGGGNQASSAGFESDRMNKLFQAASEMFGIGANIRWDVLDFGRVRSNIDVQNSLQRQALLHYEQTVIGSLKDVESALTAYFDEQKRKSSFDTQVYADQESVKITQELYRIGLANELQLLKVRKNLISSELNLTTSEQSLTSDLIALYKSLGGCWRSQAE